MAHTMSVMGWPPMTGAGGSGCAHKDRQDQQVTGRTNRAIHCSQLESKVSNGKSIFAWRERLKPA